MSDRPAEPPPGTPESRGVALAGPPRPGRSRLERSLRALGGTIVVAGFAFLTGLWLFDRVYMPRFTRQAGDVVVPDLANLNREQAEAVLTRARLRFSVVAERFDPAVPRGFVIAQDPEPGRPVRAGRPVHLALSLGEEFANVPELFGESLRGARLLLDRAGLRSGALGRVVTSETGPGLVVSAEPPFGAVVPRGTVVNLLVGAQREAEAFIMPDLVGRDAQAAERDLEALGFRVQVDGPGSNFARIDTQDPQPGARVLRGQNIVLRVAGRLIQ
ncbi:MAG: PASTA domain-containing protein [Candidatus Eisenbacteria bacterium]